MSGVFGSKTVSTTNPRISNFQVTQSSYGAPISIGFGTNRISGTMIDYDDFTAIAHTTTTKSGGKGGSVKSKQTSWTYTVAAAIALGEGRGTGIGKVWSGKNVGDLASNQLTFFDGSVGQSPWGYMVSKHPTKALSYSGTCYVAGVIDLGDSSSMQNFNFELYGLCQSQQGTPSNNITIQYAYQKEVEVSNYSSNIKVQEYVYGNGWTTLDSRFYTIEQKKDSYGNKIAGVYVYTFNFDDRKDGYDRADPLRIRINYNAITASVQYTATDANPRDIIYELVANEVYGCQFPVDYIDDWSDYSTYCKTNSLLLSPAYTSQQQASDMIAELLEATNSDTVWSQGKMKLVPYYDELTPIYDITEDHMLDQGDNSLVTTRTAQSDRYNVVPLEYVDRDNDYNTDIVYAVDQGDIDLNGLRQMSTKSHHEITTKTLAQTAAQMILQKQLYVTNQRVVKLPQAFVLLEPMDPNTLACSIAGLDPTTVRVVSVKESKDDYSLEFTFEDNPTGAMSAPEYETQAANRANVNYNVSPGNVSAPVIFEAPDTLVSSGLGFEVWIGVSGLSRYWGGCSVWVSDDGNTYKWFGNVTSPARQGILSALLPSGVDPDATNVARVNLAMSSGELSSGTKRDADNYNTLCYVDGEFISYQTATLIGVNQYDLSYLRRGAYNSTIASHNVGTRFLRVDEALFKYPFTQDDIGKSIYLKFTSINIYGSGEQSLADAKAYQYTIKGTALTSPLPVVQNIRTYYENGNMYLIWDSVSDFRSPIEYEIRKGSSWNSAEVLGRTFNTKFQTQGNGNYFISAAYNNVYSAIPSDILITGARYTQNVIATFDEAETGWTGSLTGGAALRENTVYLKGAGNFDDIPDVDGVSNIDFYGGASPEGIYTIPSEHMIDIGESELCTVSINYTAYGNSIAGNFDEIQDVDSLENWDGEYSKYVGFKVQINIADNDGVFAGWQDFYAGQYNGRIFDFRIILYSYEQNTTAILSGFSFAVDVPDKTESKNVTVPASGISILYTSNFHAIPQPQITIFNAEPGDDIILTAQTLMGFTIQVVNSGIGVERDINYLVQSY